MKLNSSTGTRKKILVHKKAKNRIANLKIEPLESVDMIKKRDFMPIMIGSGDSTKLLLVSPSKKH